jgi:RNA-binding protein YlmH
MMNLGLKRDKFGDILIQDQQLQISVAKEISNYIQMELTKVGSTSISIEPVSEPSYMQVHEVWEENEGTVSSLRVDTLLAEIYRLSRSKVIPHIKGGNVKVNWRVIEQPSYEIKAGDYISLRGFGRAKFLEIQGKTKREKWRIRYGTRK